MDSRGLVVAGGLGLVAVNFWTSNQRPAITDLVFGTKSGAGAQTDARSAALGIAGELLLVLVLSLAAGASDSVATGMLAIIGALWVLWGIHYYTAPHRTA